MYPKWLLNRTPVRFDETPRIGSLRRPAHPFSRPPILPPLYSPSSHASSQPFYLPFSIKSIHPSILPSNPLSTQSSCPPLPLRPPSLSLSFPPVFLLALLLSLGRALPNSERTPQRKGVCVCVCGCVLHARTHTHNSLTSTHTHKCTQICTSTARRIYSQHCAHQLKFTECDCLH